MSIPHDNLLSQGGTSFNTAQSILEVQYGDGYGQRAEDGLNSLRRQGSLAWIPLTQEQRDSVHSHWVNVGVVETFSWTAPNDIERRWRYASGINETSVGDKFLLSVSVREEFE